MKGRIRHLSPTGRRTALPSVLLAAIVAVCSAPLAVCAADWPSEFDWVDPYACGDEWTLLPRLGRLQGFVEPSSNVEAIIESLAAQPIVVQPPELLESADEGGVVPVGYLYVLDEGPSLGGAQPSLRREPLPVPTPAPAPAPVPLPVAAPMTLPPPQAYFVQPQPPRQLQPEPQLQPQPTPPTPRRSTTFTSAPTIPALPTSQPEPPSASDPPRTPTGQPGTDTTYGKRPETPVVRRQFLRTQSPLLKQGDWQFDVGVAYTLFEYNFPTIDPNANLVRADIRRRTLVAPLAVRYGWSDRLQLYCNVPVGWRNTEIATSPFTTPNPINDSSSYGGVGDVQIGGAYLLRRGCNMLPDVVVTLNGGLPTGEKSVLSNVSQGGLGTGFGSLGAQTLFIHTYDPVAIYWGGGYSYYFEGTIEGVPVQLGDQILYQLGAGFAINDRVTFSSGLIGAYINQTQVNGRKIRDSQQEPLRFRSAVTVLRCSKIVEPFVEIGLTDSAPSFRTGVTWTY